MKPQLTLDEVRFNSIHECLPGSHIRDRNNHEVVISSVSNANYPFKKYEKGIKQGLSLLYDKSEAPNLDNVMQKLALRVKSHNSQSLAPFRSVKLLRHGKWRHLSGSVKFEEMNINADQLLILDPSTFPPTPIYLRVAFFLPICIPSYEIDVILVCGYVLDVVTIDQPDTRTDLFSVIKSSDSEINSYQLLIQTDKLKYFPVNIIADQILLHHNCKNINLKNKNDCSMEMVSSSKSTVFSNLRHDHTNMEYVYNGHLLPFDNVRTFI